MTYIICLPILAHFQKVPRILQKDRYRRYQERQSGNIHSVPCFVFVQDPWYDSVYERASADQ